MAKCTWRVETVDVAELQEKLNELERDEFEITQVTPVGEGERFTVIARKTLANKKPIGF
ncbi:MAG: hypothetical protein ACO1SX_19690 [Actinomycetota bacterium]